MLSTILCRGALVVSLLAGFGQVAGAATAKEPQILLWGIQGDCSGKYTDALSKELDEMSLKVERPSLLPTEEQRTCLPKDCAELARKQDSLAPFKGYYLLGGHFDEQGELARYRVWLYRFDTGQTVSASKWFKGGTPSGLPLDMARSIRQLLQDFDRECCTTPESIQSVNIAECMEPFPADLKRNNRPRSALLIAANAPQVSPTQQKPELNRFAQHDVFRMMRKLSDLQLEGYSGDGQARLRLESEQQAREIVKRRKDYQAELLWNGTTFDVRLCQQGVRNETTTMLCRQHPRPVEDNASDQELAKDLVARLRDLYQYSGVAVVDRTKLCAPFEISQCKLQNPWEPASAVTVAQNAMLPMLTSTSSSKSMPSTAAAPESVTAAGVKTTGSSAPSRSGSKSVASIVTAAGQSTTMMPIAGASSTQERSALSMGSGNSPSPASITPSMRGLGVALWTFTALGVGATSAGLLLSTPICFKNNSSCAGQYDYYNPLMTGTIVTGAATGLLFTLSLAYQLVHRPRQLPVRSFAP